jgi:predicted GNAT family acetyltransferase
MQASVARIKRGEIQDRRCRISLRSMRATSFAQAPYIHAMPAEVRQNAARSRFELDVDGHIAFANYHIADGLLAITHTETPPALRERGIGSELVVGALAHIRAQGLKVRPLCSFARHVIAQHPETQDLLARD